MCCSCRLIIRAISVLEGIALVANPDFAIVDESFPFVAKKMLTDQSPRLQAALQYMVRLTPGITKKNWYVVVQYHFMLLKVTGGCSSLTAVHSEHRMVFQQSTVMCNMGLY